MRIGRKIAVIQTDEQRHAVAVLARTQIKLVVELLRRIISVIAVRRVVSIVMMPTPMLYFSAIALVFFLERVNLDLRQHLFIVEHARLVCRRVNGIRAAELCGLVSFLRLGGRGVALIRYIVLNRKGRKQQQKHCQERSQTQFSLVFIYAASLQKIQQRRQHRRHGRGNGGKQAPEPLSVHRQVTDHAPGLTVHRKHVILPFQRVFSIHTAAARNARRCV